MSVTTGSVSSRGLRVFCLTLLAALVVAMAPRQASAAHREPFRASFTTEFDSVVEFPYAIITVVGEGHALHMGATTASSTDQTVNLITGEGTATYTLTAANGDTVVLALEFQTTFVESGVTFEGTYVVIGGTGRFAGATGSGTAGGSATFTGPDNGVGSFEVSGTISRRCRR